MKKKKIATVPLQRVLVNFIQDISGSMASVAGRWNETASGFEVFVSTLKAEKGIDYRFSLLLFNTVVNSPYTGVALKAVDSRYLYGVKPNGGTALLDAVGAAIQTTKNKSFEADKVINVIVTDGEENSSTVWSKEALHAIVDTELNGGKTTFQYLGAQPESWTDAAAFGIVCHSVAQYNPDNAIAVYACVAKSLNKFANDTTVTASTGMTQSYASADTLSSAKLKFDSNTTDDKS